MWCEVFAGSLRVVNCFGPLGERTKLRNHPANDRLALLVLRVKQSTVGRMIEEHLETARLPCPKP